MLSNLSLPKFYPVRNVHHMMSREFGVSGAGICDGASACVKSVKL